MKFYKIRLKVQEHEDAPIFHPQRLIGAPTLNHAIGLAINEFSGNEIIEPYYTEEIYPESVLCSQVFYH